SVPGRPGRKGPMAPTLSERIVACLLGLAKRIEAWAEAHPDAPLAEQEWAVLGLVRAALPALLAAVLLACTPGLSEPGLSARQPCPGCGKGRRPLGRRGRTVLTVCGAVTFARAYYYCRECRRGWAPADGGLGLAPRQRLSERVRGGVGWAGAASGPSRGATWGAAAPPRPSGPCCWPRRRGGGRWTWSGASAR